MTGGRTGFTTGRGVNTPDWSVVTSTVVSQALRDMFETCNWDKRWSEFDADEDLTRRSILEIYASKGRAPRHEEIAVKTGFRQDKVRDLITRLAARDMVVLDQDTGPGRVAILGAYPFIDRYTGYLMHLNGKVLNAMCAIDALGTGAMLGTDVIINSSCRKCSAAIDIQTGEQGAVLDDFNPKEAVVWSGMQYGDNCSANSLCTTMTFFCNDDHLATWLNEHDTEPRGYRLSMQEGIEMGKAIFVPLLAKVVDTNLNKEKN